MQTWLGPRRKTIDMISVPAIYLHGRNYKYQEHGSYIQLMIQAISSGFIDKFYFYCPEATPGIITLYMAIDVNLFVCINNGDNAS